jgi:hypothetical protein
MTTEQALAAYDLPSETQVARRLEAIDRFRSLVRANLKEGHDYGVIPGTPRPTLLKPGAEKIKTLMECADTYEILDKVEDWDKPLFFYTIKCRLVYMHTDVVVSEGLGHCNSMEARYRWRHQDRSCPECNQETIIKGKQEYGGGWLCFAKKGGCGAKFPDGAESIESQKVGRVENEDVFSQVNTLLKMAKKRSLVDAALSAGRLSDIFTQDLEDMRPVQPSAPPYDIVEAEIEPEIEAPSEEIPQTPYRAPESATEQPAVRMCSEHGEEFFMRGKMKSYAHPIGETGRWCNEPSGSEPLVAEVSRSSLPLERVNAGALQRRAKSGDTLAPPVIPDPLSAEEFKIYGVTHLDWVHDAGSNQKLQEALEWLKSNPAKTLRDAMKTHVARRMSA